MSVASEEEEDTFFNDLEELRQNFARAEDRQFRREALFLAVRRNRVEIVKFLLVADDVDVHSTDHSGDTLLIMAASWGCCEMASFLLDEGADVGATNSGGAAALHFAISSEMMQLLIDHGADVNVLDSQGQTPLHACAGLHFEESAQQVEEICVLVASGANVMAVDDPVEGEQSTPLHLLLESASVEVVQYFLGLFETPKAMIKALMSEDVNGQLPFHLVRNLETAALLIKSLMNDATPRKAYPPTICRDMILAKDENKKTSLDISRDRFEDEVTRELLCSWRVLRRNQW